MSIDIAAGNFEGARVNINRDCMRLGTMKCDGNRDGRRTGADIEKTGGIVLRKRRDGLTDEKLGFGARNEDAWIDLEFDRVELFLPNQIGDRFTLCPLFDQFAKASSVGRGDLSIEEGVEIDSLTRENMREKDFSVQSR
jgi:hypothetical protein